jgi:hypothetical protein
MTAGRKVNTSSHGWCTPHKYVQAVQEVFGGTIHLDPCSNKHSIVQAKTEYLLPQYDGLRESWNFPTIYVNPPYGLDKERGTSIKNWLAMCAATHEAHNSEVIALVPVAVNTGHWKKFIFTKAQSICFLYDTRLRFLENGLDAGKGAPMACAMIYWGRNPQKFYSVFIEHGAVVDISNLIGENIGSDRKYLTLFDSPLLSRKKVIDIAQMERMAVDQRASAK